MSNKAVATITFYIGSPDQPDDRLSKKYALNNWSQEWALKIQLDEIAKELNYISGYGIWSIKVKSKELNFVVDYKWQFKPYKENIFLRFQNTLKFKLGHYTGWHGGKVYLEIPRIRLPEGDNLFRINRSAVGSKKQIRKRGTMYYLSYNRSDSTFISFQQKLTESVFGPNTQKEWQHSAGTFDISWWELPKTQTSRHRWDKQRKQQEVAARKRKKLEKEGIVYKDKKKQKKARQVYIIQVDHESMSDVYKIGISNAPGKRLQTLNTSNPFELDILHKFVADPAEEAEGKLHQRFEQTRLSGEWFRLTDAQILEICKIIGYTNGEFITERDEIPFDLVKMQQTENTTDLEIINYKGVEIMAIQGFGLGFGIRKMNIEDVLWLYEHNQNNKDVYVATLSGRLTCNLLDFKESKEFTMSIKFGNWNAETMQCVDELMKRFDLTEQ